MPHGETSSLIVTSPASERVTTASYIAIEQYRYEDSSRGGPVPVVLPPTHSIHQILDPADANHASYALARPPSPSISRRLKDAFELDARSTKISTEVYCGFIQFVSCLYVLPVVPKQMLSAGYEVKHTIVTIAITCAVGSILSSYVTNLPFIVAPPTSVSIYLAVALQQFRMTPAEGNVAVIISGFCLLVIGLFKPLNRIVTKASLSCRPMSHLP
jgi:hypothetical protein